MGDPDRLLRRVQPFELSFVMHQDFLEAARVEPANRPRAPIADRREVPSVAEVAAELRLAALRLSPRVGEPPIPEPLLAAELGPRRILRRSEREESLKMRLEHRLSPRLMVRIFLFLFYRFILSSTHITRLL